MKTARKLTASHCLRTTSVLLLTWLLVAPNRAAAQAAGNNAVYSGTTNSSIVGSSSFIDASVLPSTATHDVCFRINYALYLLTLSPYNGAGVIDARGINTSNSSSSSGALTCNYSPWSSSSGQQSFTSFPNAVILLPAGTIGLKSTATPWVLPDRTRIIGVGSGANDTFVTTLQAGPGVSGPMIEMGGSSGTPVPCPATSNVCNDVAVEDLRIDGANVAGVIGIQNQYSQELSYVNRVTFYRVKGTGLQVCASGSMGAQNSGPYTNIRFEYPSGVTPAGTTVCAQIIGAPTRGIHGLTCSNLSTTIPSVAVNVDSPSNSIEDVFITGFGDGIQVGANGSAQSNTLLNISGAFGSGNLIHLCAGISCGSSSNVVTDASIIGATNSSSGGDIIRDEVSSTSVSDAHVGIYVLGEAVSNAGYSRFTTSPNWPNWSVGSASLTVGSSCTAGSLYSNTSGSSGSNDTLYVCLGGSGSGAGWQDIK